MSITEMVAEKADDEADRSKTPNYDLLRDVYCVLGVPIDAVDMYTAIDRINWAVRNKSKLLISTVNLNYLINFSRDAEFRHSVIQSDLCVADGMLIVWLARLCGIPILDRVTGADLFARLKFGPPSNNPFKVFLFGGAEGVAAAAARAINDHSQSVRCVGSLYPGFGSSEELS